MSGARVFMEWKAREGAWWAALEAFGPAFLILRRHKKEGVEVRNSPHSFGEKGSNSDDLLFEGLHQHEGPDRCCGAGCGPGLRRGLVGHWPPEYVCVRVGEG